MKSHKVADKRTQIYLPRDIHNKLKTLSDQQDKSMAYIIREAIVSHLREPSPEYITGDNDLLEVVGIIKGKDRDVSKNLRKYLKQMYQEKK
jgi:predicted DNA-binding protein